MDVLVTNNLTKKYRDFYATKDVNMHIEKGDIYGFVGENGAGKTTIIRMIAGLAEPTEGTFNLFGVNNTDPEIKNVKRKMASIVEVASLAKSMTALQNMRFQSYVTNVKKSDDELIALIKKVGLDYDAIKKRKVGNFSLGMRQRLAIACILIADPEFIMLDEPMNGLDPQGFIEIRDIIMNLSAEGVTFLISSHILSELEKMCNKVGFISHGHLIEELSIDEIHNRSRKHIALGFDDPESVLPIIQEGLELNDCTIQHQNILIYDNIDINQVIAFLVNKHINVKRIDCVEETIENYYVELIGKVNNND